MPKQKTGTRKVYLFPPCPLDFLHRNYRIIFFWYWLSLNSFDLKESLLLLNSKILDHRFIVGIPGILFLVAAWRFVTFEILCKSSGNSFNENLIKQIINIIYFKYSNAILKYKLKTRAILLAFHFRLFGDISKSNK